MVVSKSLREFGFFDQERVSLVSRLIDANTYGQDPMFSVIDVGAHIGTTALHFASRGVPVIAIEPIPENVRLLQLGAQKNNVDSLVEVIEAAATDELQAEAGTICMQSDPNNRAHSFASGIDPSWQDRPCESVAVRTIDDILGGRKNILLIKLSTEGMEHRVLRGAMQSLLRSPPCYILLQFTPAALVAAGSDPLRFLTWLHDELAYDIHLEMNLHGPYAVQAFPAFVEEVTRLKSVKLVLQHRRLESCLSKFRPRGAKKKPYPTPAIVDASRSPQQSVDPVQEPPKASKKQASKGSSSINQSILNQSPTVPVDDPNGPIFAKMPLPPIPVITPPPMWERSVVTDQPTDVHKKLLLVGVSLSLILFIRGVVA